MRRVEWVERYQEGAHRDRDAAIDAEARGEKRLAESLRSAALGRDFVARRLARLLETGASIETEAVA